MYNPAERSNVNSPTDGGTSLLPLPPQMAAIFRSVLQIGIFPTMDQAFVARYMSVSPRYTSANRHWAHMFAATVEQPAAPVSRTDPFFIDATAHVHVIAYQIRGPTLLAVDAEGRGGREAAHPGSWWLVRGASASKWGWNTDTEVMQLCLFPALVASVAADLARGDPERVQLDPVFNVRGDAVSAICAAVVEELQAPAPLGRLYAETLGHVLAVQLLGLSSARRGCGRRTRAASRCRPCGASSTTSTRTSPTTSPSPISPPSRPSARTTSCANSAAAPATRRTSTT